MLFSYNWLQSFFYPVKSSEAGTKQFNRVKEKPRSRTSLLRGRLPKPEKLAELLNSHIFEVEEVKKIKNDFIFDLDVLPNRAHDCFSHIGVAKEIAAITGLKFNISDIKIKEGKKIKAKDFIGVKVKNKTACPRYNARVITGVKIISSPKWIQEKLKICGLRPINNIVDIANYVMLETGQPLHAFDGKKIEGKKIIVRPAKKNERIITLDEEKYTLDDDILVIADLKNILAIAGIKGGKKAEIDKDTKTIVLESANFSPSFIRSVSKKINLRTDASIRFEQGIDPNLTEFAINRTAKLIQESVGGEIASGLIDVYPKKIGAKKMKLDLDYMESLLGVKISKKEVIKILEKLGLKIENCKLKILNVVIPTFRLDISIQEDLIEEIGRIYGYQNIPAVFPVVSLVPPKRNLDIFWENMIKNALKESGFTETYNYSFISESDREIFGYSEKDLFELENPISIEYKYLRPNLIINLLKNIRRNQKDFKEINIFELGKTFKKLKITEEKKMLAGTMAGDSFYRLKGVLDLLLNKMGISDIWYDDYKPVPSKSKISIWHLQRSAEIKVGNEKIGFLGEISSDILKKMKISKKVVAFNIDFKKLLKLASEENEYQPLSLFPAAVRDLAVFVPRGIKVVEVLNRINIAGGKLVRDVDIFDIYEGEELPDGKKNLAFHIIYQSQTKTLTSEEIDNLQQKIIKALEQDPEWEVRK